MNGDYVDAVQELNLARRAIAGEKYSAETAKEISDYMSEALTYVLKNVELIESNELKKSILDCLTNGL